MMKIELTGRNFETDEKMKRYVEDKIGALERYLPRQVRATASCNVVLEDDTNGREDNRYVCEAVVSVQGTQMVSREGTVNMYAAVDIVEAKLQVQIVKFKEKYTDRPRRLRMLSRWTGRTSEADEETPEQEPV